MKKLLILLVAAFVILTLSAFAGNTGEKAFGDIYYKVLPTGQNPVYPPNGTDWTKVSGAVNITVNDGNNLFIAVENGYVAESAAEISLTLNGSNLFEFDMDAVWADPPEVIVSQRGAYYIDEVAGRAIYFYRFVPQPDWHYFKLANAAKGSINVTSIEAVPNCYVPSLTTYGIAALVLILIASSIFVIYRRRKMVTA